MSDSIHVSNEVDRRAYLAGKNITSMARYRADRKRLNQIKDELALQITQQFPDALINNIESAIKSAQQFLENGATFKEALGYARNLLTIVKA